MHSEVFERVCAIQKSPKGPLALERLWGRGRRRILFLGILNFKMLLIVLRTFFTRCLFSTNTPCVQHIIVDGPTMLVVSVWSLWEQVLCTFCLTAPLAQFCKMPFNCIYVYFHRNRKFQDHSQPQSPYSMLYLKIKAYQSQRRTQSILWSWILGELTLTVVIW